MHTIKPIETNRSPREILADHFESLGDELPIRGGWGYTKPDACIIDKNDPAVDTALPFDWIGIQNVFVEKRIYEEMIISRPEGEMFSGIKWDLQEQHLIEEGGQYYDRLIFEITGFKKDDWEHLKGEWEGPAGIDHPDFDILSHEKKREDLQVSITREFWFDITNFHGE